MIKKYIKNKITMASIALLAICLSVAGIMRAFATTDSTMLSFSTSGEVSLDGVNGAQVAVNLTAAQAGKLYVAQGSFSTTENDDSNHYFAVHSLTPGSATSSYSLDSSSSSGQYYYKYSQAGDGVNFAAGDHLYELVYNVAAETPAGTYHLPISVEYVQGTSLDDYEEEVVVNATVTVTRNDAPVTKPSQVVTFVTEGNTIGNEGITKEYGDANFTVTKTVTTGDGEIIDYHPDDDGTGSIAFTIPGGDVVGVGIPGDVEICAWVGETENYAATKACYTVHVQKREVAITDVTIADKSYNGMTDGTTTSVSFSNQTENATLTSSDYTTDTVFSDANAGEDKNVSVTVTLVDEAANNYNLTNGTFNTTKTITPYVLTASNIELLGGGTYAYDPDGVEPEVRVQANTHGGITTLGSDDYEVTYGNNTTKGTGHAYVRGKGNFTTGENPLDIEFTIEERGINNDNLVTPSSIVEGHVLTADEISVNVDGHDLVQCANAQDTNCDYILQIEGENDGVAGHSVHISVNAREGGNYAGVAVRDITVVAKLTQTVTFGDITNTTVNKTYGDTEFTNQALTDGDGTITYQSSASSVASVDSNGKVTINGVGEADITATASETDTYASGTASYHISVGKKTISVSNVTISNKVFDGTTTATVTDATLSDDDLLLGDGFSIEEAHFTSANAASYDDVYVRIALDDDAFAFYQFGSNSKTAETTGSATISALALTSSNTTVILNTTSFEYDGEAKEPTATVTVDLNNDGTKETSLTAGTDYSINYSENTNAGTATATISGTGNYTSSLPAIEFTIDKATVSNVQVSITEQTYTGSALEPSITVTGVVGGNNVTFTTDDYTIAEHEDFINAGDHTVTISAKESSNYNIPTTNGTFTIAKAASEEPTNIPSDLEAGVNQTLADLGDLPEGYEWVDPTTPVTAGMNDYPATYTKNGDSTNYAPVDVTIPVLGYTDEYEVINGDGQEHIIGVDGAVEFEIDADYDLFENNGEVYVDNELVEPANYDSWSGSTIISLSANYADSLATGNHTIAILFNDGGVARASFTVSEPETESESEQEEQNPGVADTGSFTKLAGGATATIIIATALSALITLGYVAKKRKS